MRYYSIDVAASTGEKTSTYLCEHTKGNDSAKTGELYTYQTVKLTDLAPELASIGKFHMDRKLRIELQVNTAANCLASNMSVSDV